MGVSADICTDQIVAIVMTLKKATEVPLLSSKIVLFKINFQTVYSFLWIIRSWPVLLPLAFGVRVRGAAGSYLSWVVGKGSVAG